MSELLLAVLQSDGAELQQVNTNLMLDVEKLEAAFAGAPQLQVLNAYFYGTVKALLPCLRSDPPYGPLRVNELMVRFTGLELEVAEDDVVALAAAIVSLRAAPYHLFLAGVTSSRGFNALVDAAAERRIASLGTLGCVTDAQTVPALARLLQRGSLTKLDFNCRGFPLAEDVPRLCEALRSCRTLTHLELCLNTYQGATPRAVTELLDAVATIPALSALSLRGSVLRDKAAAGRALGALLGANLPSLHTLIVSSCALGDEGVAPLLVGLAANTHLRKLRCERNRMSEAFSRDQLEPALAALAARANLDA